MLHPICTLQMNFLGTSSARSPSRRPLQTHHATLPTDALKSAWHDDARVSEALFLEGWNGPFARFGASLICVRTVIPPT